LSPFRSPAITPRLPNALRRDRVAAAAKSGAENDGQVIDWNQPLDALQAQFSGGHIVNVTQPGDHGRKYDEAPKYPIVNAAANGALYTAAQVPSAAVLGQVAVRPKAHSRVAIKLSRT